MTNYEMWKSKLSVEKFVDIIIKFTEDNVCEECSLSLDTNYCKYNSDNNPECHKWLMEWATAEADTKKVKKYLKILDK